MQAPGPIGDDYARYAGSLAPLGGPGIAASEPIVHGQPTRPTGWRGSRPILATVSALVAVGVLGGGAWAWTARQDHGPADRTPVVLPETLGGYGKNTLADFGADPQWITLMRSKVYGPDHAFAGRGYAARKANGRVTVPALNLVVVRGNFPNGGDIGMAAEPFTEIGAARCTRTFDLHRGGDDPMTENLPKGPHSSQELTLCFRADRTLTVSVLAIGHSVPYDQVAAAVSEAWAVNAK